MKALRLEEYAPRRPLGQLALQQALFSYKEVINRRELLLSAVKKELDI